MPDGWGNLFGAFLGHGFSECCSRCVRVRVCLLWSGDACRKLAERYSQDIEDRRRAIEREEYEKLKTTREKQASQNRVCVAGVW